jgi:hypothetical protein
MRYLALLLLLLTACTPTRTVPSEVFEAGIPTIDVLAVAMDEVAHIGTQIPLPPHSVVLIDRYGTLGNAVITAQPVRYVIVLWTRYFREEQVRFVVAHESGHIALDMWGVAQDEALADLFAYCYGTDKARAWAQVYGVSGDCAIFEEVRR